VGGRYSRESTVDDDGFSVSVGQFTTTVIGLSLPSCQ
jgi:hypothetical protein